MDGDHPTNEAAEQAALVLWNTRADSEALAALKAIMAAYTEAHGRTEERAYYDKVDAWKLAKDVIEKAKGSATNHPANPA